MDSVREKTASIAARSAPSETDAEVQPVVGQMCAQLCKVHTCVHSNGNNITGGLLLPGNRNLYLTSYRSVCVQVLQT